MTDRFILDITRTPTGVTVWERTAGRFTSTSHAFEPSFLLSFPDPHRWYELLDGLEETCPLTPCRIQTIHGNEEGFIVSAGRETADRIELQTGHEARLYNVDIRPEQRYAAENNSVPGGIVGADRIFAEPYGDLSSLTITCRENPHRDTLPRSVTIRSDDKETVLSGPERQIVADLMDTVGTLDPDLILFPGYDTWSHAIGDAADRMGIVNTFSRTGRFRILRSRSYYSYGRMEHRLGARLPEGRLIMDTRQSYLYREGGLAGILLASRLTGLSPNLTCRLTPGTLVSGYEVYEALIRGIAVPYRKQDTEACRQLADMRLEYRGGYMHHPVPGIFAWVTQIDFTSFYPSIIVSCNLSPETLAHPGGTEGFLPMVLEPLLRLRQETKQRKRTDHRYREMDGILKWMLVTCFGYTGYKNARFGRIEVHEQITLNATRILKECIGLTESQGAKMLHAIIDCIFFTGGDPGSIESAIRQKTGFHTESESYDWLVILPQADGSGAYGSYFGRLVSGGVKMRGVAARRRDMPPYVRRMQEELLALLATRRDPDDLLLLEDEASARYHRYRDGILAADLADLVITRRIGRSNYKNESIPQAVIRMYRQLGVELLPGMDASYLVMDEEKKVVCPAWEPESVDGAYYRRLIDRAWNEVAYVFHREKTPVTLEQFMTASSEG